MDKKTNEKLKTEDDSIKPYKTRSPLPSHPPPHHTQRKAKTHITKCPLTSSSSYIILICRLSLSFSLSSSLKLPEQCEFNATMAHPDLTSPLLTPSQSSDPSHTILTIHEPSHNHKRQQNRTQNQRQSSDTARESSSNPFGFMGLSPITVPPQPTVDPFKNATERIEGIYEIIKVVICLPIALIRLVVFGLCLGVGYLATRLALEGWKDKHNPMPRWRSRLMWVTRICARCILFSFGYCLLCLFICCSPFLPYFLVNTIIDMS